MPSIELHKRLNFLYEPHPYKAIYGGRGGGKSWAVAIALLILASRRKLRILCCREVQNSIADSVHRTLCDMISRLGIESKFDTTQNRIRGANGSEFIFRGLYRDVTAIRSMEAVDIAWVEEAQVVSEQTWVDLIPTIRKDGSEIWVTFNLCRETDPTHKRFITNPLPGAKVVELGWWHNKWFPEKLRKHKDHLYAVDPESADHIYGGKTKKRSKEQILGGKWVVEPFIPGDDWAGPYFGIDWGFSVSPTAAVKCWVSGDPKELDHELWIEHEAWGVGVDNDELPEFLGSVPGLKEHVAHADSARPETISHVNNNGFEKVESCKKWPGSVEDGLAHLRGYKRIVVHPRCKYVQQDFRLYSHKTDRLTGEVLPIIIKLNDDCVDAIRYGLGPLIRYDPPPSVSVI